MPNLTVQPGDTLARLSRRSGMPACMLMRANHLASDLAPGTLRPGQQLTVDPTYCMRNGVCEPLREGSFSCQSRSVEALPPGESLLALARRVRVPLRLILMENNLDDPEQARPGMPLAIPRHGAARLVTLHAPQSPEALAKAYGVDVRELMYVNRIPAGSALLPGQQILIPAA